MLVITALSRRHEV